MMALRPAFGGLDFLKTKVFAERMTKMPPSAHHPMGFDYWNQGKSLAVVAKQSVRLESMEKQQASRQGSERQWEGK